MSDVFDNLIDRQSPPNDPTRIAAVISSDQRFEYFGTSAFTVRLLRLDKKIARGMPMSCGAWRTCSGPTPCCSGNSAIGFRSIATRR
jgi:hypothetical protein